MYNNAWRNLFVVQNNELLNNLKAFVNLVGAIQFRVDPGHSRSGISYTLFVIK